MSNPQRLTGFALALAASLATAGSGIAQTVTAAPTEPVIDEPVPVPQDAPRGSSGEIAIGAMLGVIGGVLVLALILGSGSD